MPLVPRASSSQQSSKSEEPHSTDSRSPAMSGVDQLTASERGLRRAYDLLKEQADALRAAKQADLQAKLVAARREAEASGSNCPAIGFSGTTGDSKGLKRPSTGGGPKRPTMMGDGSGRVGARRSNVVSLQSRRKHEMSEDLKPGVLTGEGWGKAPSQEEGAREGHATSGRAGPRTPGSGGAQNGKMQTEHAGTRSNISVSLDTLSKRPKQADDFVIPKKAKLVACDEGALISDIGQHSDAFGSTRSLASSAVSQGGGLLEHEGTRAGKEIGAVFVEGKSLDRARFPTQWLARGALEEWDSRQAEGPLVMPLKDFGIRPESGKKKVLALRMTVASTAKRFTINICPGPLAPEEGQEVAPKDVIAHFNPRRIYKNGSLVYNARYENRWIDDPPPTVPLKGLPPLFCDSPVTLLISFDKDLVSLALDDQPACEIFLNADGRGEALDRLDELVLHLPIKEDTVGFQEEIVLHEVWWSPEPPAEQGRGERASAAGAESAPSAPLDTEVARAAAAAAAAVIDLGVSKGAGRATVGHEGRAADMQPQFSQPLPFDPAPARYGPLMSESHEKGVAGGSDGMGMKLSRLGGLLRSVNERGPGSVVAVNNLPETQAQDAVERIKEDLRTLFQGVGQCPREVHFKPNSSTAFVVLDDPRDLTETVKCLDWAEYAGKKLRMSRSSKRSF